MNHILISVWWLCELSHSLLLMITIQTACIDCRKRMKCLVINYIHTDLQIPHSRVCTFLLAHVWSLKAGIHFLGEEIGAKVCIAHEPQIQNSYKHQLDTCPLKINHTHLLIVNEQKGKKPRLFVFCLFVVSVFFVRGWGQYTIQ